MNRSGKGKCSCWMCKPWKHGIEPKYKASERRKLQPEPDDSEAYENHLFQKDVDQGKADLLTGNILEITTPEDLEVLESFDGNPPESAKAGARLLRKTAKFRW